MEEKKIGVLSHSFHVFRNWLVKNNYDKNKYVCITSMKDVVGQQFEFVLEVLELEGNWLDDIGHILQYLQSKNIEVIKVMKGVKI